MTDDWLEVVEYYTSDLFGSQCVPVTSAHNYLARDGNRYRPSPNINQSSKGVAKDTSRGEMLTAFSLAKGCAPPWWYTNRIAKLTGLTKRNLWNIYFDYAKKCKEKQEKEEPGDATEINLNDSNNGLKQNLTSMKTCINEWVKQDFCIEDIFSQVMSNALNNYKFGPAIPSRPY